MANQNEKLRTERLLIELDPPLRDLGREVLNPNTTVERLRKIIKIGTSYHTRNTDSADETPVIIWSDYTDEQLSEMLVSDDIPGHMKDEIAGYVVGRIALPPENE